MTRKRFVKLLMARGISRNSANALADAKNAQYSYEQAYAAMKMTVSPGLLADAVKSIYMMMGQVLRGMGECLKQSGEAMCKYSEGL